MASRPNVLVILCDQMRPFELGCYGHPTIRSPHIDSLAAEGCRFEQALTNNPVCVPARSILLSGQYSRTCTGSLWNHAPWWPASQERRRLRDPTLADCLQGAGYRTSHIGKWHIDPDPRLVGFEQSVQAVRVGSRGVFSENGHEPFEVQLFSEDYQVHRFAQMLAETDERPFFCYYNIYWPHMPLAHMPLAYQRRYGRDAVRLRANVPSGGQEPFDERWFHCYLWEHSRSPGDLQPITEQLPDGFDLGDLTALYYGAVTWVDDLVGALLERLEGAGLADDTIVVFTSDHGDNLGSHGDWNKDRFWEESIRIPWCMRGPGIDGGQVHRCEQAQLIDVMPTLLDCCGLPVPETVQGRSLLPILNGERADLDRPTAFIETGSYEICARTLSHKYVQRIQRPGPPIRSWLRSVADQEGRFAFDLVQDPYELDGRSALEDSTDLAAQVTRWDAETPWLN